jgi:hypothetical protein
MMAVKKRLVAVDAGRFAQKFAEVFGRLPTDREFEEWCTTWGGEVEMRLHIRGDMKKKRQPVMVVIPPAPPQEVPEEVEVCERAGDKVVCRRRVEKRRAVLA